MYTISDGSPKRKRSQGNEYPSPNFASSATAKRFGDGSSRFAGSSRVWTHMRGGLPAPLDSVRASNGVRAARFALSYMPLVFPPLYYLQSQNWNGVIDLLPIGLRPPTCPLGQTNKRRLETSRIILNTVEQFRIQRPSATEVPANDIQSGASLLWRVPCP